MESITQKIEREFGPLRMFNPHIEVDPINKRVHIFLEDCSYHAEWIKGESGDVALYRANDDNRVVGAFLPLRKWGGNFPVYTMP